MSGTASSAERVREYLAALKTSIVDALEHSDGHGTFRHDGWQRAAGGGGESSVLTDGGLFE